MSLFHSRITFRFWKYGCIVGYPNDTFRGKRAITRYEFAAGLNACLNQIERLLATTEAVLREDLFKLQRLMRELAELAFIGARVDNLESRLAFLEDHQFSTTTKLSGEVIFPGASRFCQNIGCGLMGRWGDGEKYNNLFYQIKLQNWDAPALTNY